MDNKAIGANIRKARKKKRMTQRELGDAISRTESSIAKYEQGLVDVPNNVLSSIAAVLDVSTFYLLGDESALSPSEIKASMGFEGYLKSLGYEFIEDYEYNGKECLLCIDRNQKKLFLVSEKQTLVLERSICDFTKYTIAEFLRDGEEISDTDGWFSQRTPPVESTSPAPEGTDTTPAKKQPESP